MASEATISSIDWSSMPAGAETVSVYYKVWNATDYTLVNDDVTVETNGDFTAPVNITGLTAGQTYNYMVVNNCGSPQPFYVFTQILP